MTIPVCSRLVVSILLPAVFACLLAACGTRNAEDTTFTLRRLTPEQNFADLKALLAEDPYPTSEPDDLFDVATEIARRAPAACSPEFVAKRWHPDEYRANQFEPSTGQCGRNMPPNALKLRKSIPVYWLNRSSRVANASGAAVGWSDDIARDKMQEAVAWFATFCIELDIKKVAVAAGLLANMRVAMSAAITVRIAARWSRSTRYPTR